jgi:8-oxo-dGTP diphosphatase
MITCQFESGHKAKLRHVVFDALCVRKNKLLLIKRAQFLREGGKYAFPGGFLERDETIEQGVLRELKEEAGWVGKIIKLFRIVDTPNRKGEDWQNVDFVYLVKPLKKIGQPDKETDEVKWFNLDKLPPQNQIAFDHAKTIKLYLRWKKEKFRLPLIEKSNLF